MTNLQRIPYWDNLKGILITFVVLGHYLWEYRGYQEIRGVVYALYVFHMPAFIFVSGYFSRSEHSRSIESLAKIFILFILLNFSMMFYAHAVEQRPFSIINLYYSSWFLLALFLYRATLPVCRKIPFVVPLSVGISLGLGFLRGIDNVWVLQKIITLYPFFIVGATLSTERMEGFVALLKRHRLMSWGALLVVSILTTGLILEHIIGYREILWSSYNVKWDVANRLIALVIAGSMTVILLGITPRDYIPLINKWGKNSLAIYFIHRIFSLLHVYYFPTLAADIPGLFYLASACFITLLVLGSNTVSRLVNLFLDCLIRFLVPPESLRHFRSRIVVILFLAGVFFGAIAIRELPERIMNRARSIVHLTDQIKAVLGIPSSQPLPDTIASISPQQAASVQNAVSISFVGDLILLRDQVYNAYEPRTKQYNFEPLFHYTKQYLTDADLSIGVFEGQLAGNQLEYSTSTLHDKIPIFLNFPDSFAAAVKAAGITYVTTATNHILDRDVSGAMRTLDVLDEIGLEHSGTYRNKLEKEDRDIPVINVKGLKIAILTYTYGSNNYAGDYFFDAKNTYLTSIIVDPKSPHFGENKKAVLKDFKRAKSRNPDSIIVLPHMGTQFTHVPDIFQKTWINIFIDAGADVVVADHTHEVQPIEWRQINGKDKKYSLVVNGLGNYVNSYTDSDGDAMAIAEAYLDPKTGSPLSVSIVPVWGQSMMNGNFRALPIYEIMHNSELQKEISSHDLARVREVHSLITSIMLGRDLVLDQVQKKYFLFPDGYVRTPVQPIELSKRMKSTQLYKLFSKSNSVCFIGDSITEGTMNGGYGWYEPLVAAFPNLSIYKRAWGSHTVKMLLNRMAEILDVSADVYVIAIGTNDVRYHAADRSSMTPEGYVQNVDRLVQGIVGKNPAAKFVFIAPWITDHYDPVSVLSEKEREETLFKFGQELKSYADTHQYLFIDPNPGIEKILRTEYPPKYLKDHIHPNADRGISLYSSKVLEASE